MVCTCCLPAYFFLHFACIVLVVYITTRLLVREKSSLLWKVSVWFFNGIFFLVFTSFLVLGSSEDLRAYVFSRVFFYIANLENIDPVRLHLLKGLSGRVLEIGPGPGTNFTLRSMDGLALANAWRADSANNRPGVFVSARVRFCRW